MFPRVSLNPTRQASFVNVNIVVRVNRKFRFHAIDLLGVLLTGQMFRRPLLEGVLIGCGHGVRSLGTQRDFTEG